MNKPIKKNGGTSMKKRKILSLLLSLCLLIGLLPTAALAAYPDSNEAGFKLETDSYTDGVLTVSGHVKLPTAEGISSFNVVLSWDSAVLTLLKRNDANVKYTPTNSKTKYPLSIETFLINGETEEKFGVSEADLYGEAGRAGFKINLYSTGGSIAAQKTTDWVKAFAIKFEVSGKPTDASTVLNSDSLRIADPVKDAGVIKGAFPANDTYTIQVQDAADPAKIYNYGKMAGNNRPETANNFMMTAPGTGTATYPGSTNSPSATTYTVSFDANGGTGTMADVTGISGSYTLPANGFTAPAGQQFKGWATSASGTVITGTSITVSTDTKLYAIWEPIPATEYTITFDVNGGSGTIPSQTTSGQKLSSLPTATRSGSYSFDGWYTSGGTQITTAYVFSANTTVYAHWTYTGGSSSGVVSAPTYPITVDKSVNGSVSVSNGSAVKDASVTITVKPDKGYTLETLTALDKNGYALELTEKNGRFTFKMPASAVIVKATFMDDNTMLNLFVDVKASDYFYDAVLWAAEKGVTSGTDALHFSPNAPCTRAQIVTFLWRAAGSPAPKNMSSFADVPADAFYAKAVAWAVENGITGGTGDGKFSPDATCTRAQAVTFLYRASGAPAVSGNAAFSDVATNAYYAAAVKWAEKNGITGGIGGGLFGSDNNCTRAQIVTFLYRNYQSK